MYKSLQRYSTLALAAAALFSLSACGGGDDDDGPALPKNVIVMISDGASWNTWEMAANWQAGVKANDLPAYAAMPVRLGMTTFPLTTSTTKTDTAETTLSYDPAKAWDTTLVTAAGWIGGSTGNDYTTAIAGYQYLRQNVTDSAAAGTALASGHKTYNNAINVDNFGNPVEYITQIARAQGKATGVITSVPFNHATPAAFGAQNASRNAYNAIAKSMLETGPLDVLMGAGHPEYDDNGRAWADIDPTCATNACRAANNYIAATEWQRLKAGTLKPAGATAAWKLIDDKADFEKLAAGTLSYDGPIFGIPRVASTLQQARQAAVKGNDAAQPSGVALNTTVPTLETMTKAALAALGKNQKGLFLMVEGGAVDWAAHANQTGRIIEEQVDFNRALAAVNAWVEKNSNWNETLLIVTTDHGNALPLGTASDSTAFQPITNAGAGQLPQLRWWSDNHTNEVVRVWARGKYAEKMNQYARGRDAQFAARIGHNADGSYIDNTDIFGIGKAALGR
ncbi:MULTISPECIES: alkaline phosphatase [unclassified Rubrivivax]|uniref:alkaline phosphatase n=1 Tax=unclassified Rubrivivax TaxID=2649762 RepID=UPI0013E90643|nr:MULTISPECIES: alkaline phosphatase [unclassified Rubrivivax]MCC9595309.1 alkaline phosphatase [Rubrivivax sp. JA1055]MCC9647184.1 alkaline phosphatase [Rubrivivax sp. JA1029]